MTDIVQLRDNDGRIHYTARGSTAMTRLVRYGAVDLDPPRPPEEVDEGVTDAPSAPAEDHDADTLDNRSGQRKRPSRGADPADRPRQA